MQEYPWFKNYDPSVPRTLKPYPEVTAVDLLADYVKQRPDFPMVIFKGREISYREIEEQSNAMANALIANGVKKGDRVICLFLNCPQTYVAFFAVWKAGGIVVPINPMYTPFELERSINEIEGEVAFVMSSFYQTVKSFQPRTRLGLVIPTDLDTYTTYPTKKEGDSVKLGKSDVWWADLLEKYKGSSRPTVKVNPSDGAIIMFSGGTTGTPKGVLGHHHAIIMVSMQLIAWTKPLLTDWESKGIVPLPMFHIFGIHMGFGLLLMRHMPQVLIQDPRDLKSVIETIRDYKIAFMPGTPTSFITLLNYPGLNPDDLRSLRWLIAGASPLMAETRRQIEQLIPGVHITEGYSSTELQNSNVCSPTLGKSKQGSVGMPTTDVIVRIMDSEAGTKELNVGEAGEVVIKAPQVMMGFWNRPEETAEVLRDGWVYTGDIGYLDEDGYLFLTSRKKDVIKVGGFQVWPREVEEALATHPAVAEVVVAGIPDPRQGEAAKAWIVLKEGKQVTEEELKVLAREKLVGYKVPRFYEFRKELPKLATGKVLRRVLQEEEKQKQRKNV